MLLLFGYNCLSSAFAKEILSIQSTLLGMSVTKVARSVQAMNTKRYEPGISPSRCRNLFGPVDHDQLRSELQDELRRIVKEKERRWNFDFINQKPLNGNFLWERIEDDRPIALTTIASRTEASTVSRESDNTRSTETAEANSNCRTRQAANSEANCMKTPERVTAKPPRRSPRITDYLRGKKKSVTSREIKFNRHAGEDKVSRKQVRTSRSYCRGRAAKQSTLDEMLPKLRPRHESGKVPS